LRLPAGAWAARQGRLTVGCGVGLQATGRRDGTGRTGAEATRLPSGARTGNRARRSGDASCCHSQVSASGRAAVQALAVSPAASLMKGTCSMRCSAAANTVAGW